MVNAAETQNKTRLEDMVEVVREGGGRGGIGRIGGRELYNNCISIPDACNCNTCLFLEQTGIIFVISR